MARCQPNPVPSAPAFLYGTAWKEDRTAALTELALRTRASAASTPRTSAGTTSRPASGRGSPPPTARAWSRGTTCSSRPSSPTSRGRTTGCPTIPAADLSTQVAQSMASSLEHLGHRPRRQLRAARPRLRPRLDRLRRRGVGARWCARARRRPHAAARREQRVAAAPRAAGGQRRRDAGVRAEPLLRPPRLGPRRARVLRGARRSSTRASRCSPPTREVLRHPAASRGIAARQRADAGPGGVPLRARGRDAAADRHHRPPSTWRRTWPAARSRSPPTRCEAIESLAG